METEKFELPAGGTIFNVVNSAKEKAQKVQKIQFFEFNGIYLEVRPNSEINDICLIYQLRNEIRRLKHS